MPKTKRVTKTSVTSTPSTQYRNRYQMSMDMIGKGSNPTKKKINPGY